MIIETISEYFGEIIVSRKKHKFLGLDIELLGNTRVLMLMNDYIEESITPFG